MYTLTSCCVQVVVADVPIKEILYAQNVRNALVVLADGTTREQLESLQPDLQLVMTRLNTTHLNGVMVTCQGDDQPFSAHSLLS